MAGSRHFVDVSCDCVGPKRNEMEEKIREGEVGELGKKEEEECSSYAASLG